MTNLLGMQKHFKSNVYLTAKEDMRDILRRNMRKTTLSMHTSEKRNHKKINRIKLGARNEFKGLRAQLTVENIYPYEYRCVHVNKEVGQHHFRSVFP